MLFAWFVFYVPDYLGHADNYIEANPLSTPPHIVPEWYFLPYYAILRAIPNKLLGVIAMFSSIILLCFAPWLDTSRVRSAKYRPVYKWFFWLFIITVVALGYLGSKPPEGAYVFWARVFTAYYFLHFLIVMPIVGVMETPSPLPRSITEVGAGQERTVGTRWGRPQRPSGARAGELPMIDDAPRQRRAAAACWSRWLPARRRRRLRPTRPASARHIERQKWTFGGLFGQFDDAQLQRGFKVYMEVCARCHGIKRAALPQPGRAGRPGLPRGCRQVAGRHLPGRRRAQRRGQGRQAPGHPHRPPARRPTRTSRRRATSQNGALPPDLSLIAKARGIERDTPFYVVPDNMAARHPDAATRKAAPTTSTPISRATPSRRPA